MPISAHDCRRTLLAIAIVVLATPVSLAREVGGLKFERLSKEDGLANESVLSILQDPQGFLWFATLGGLDKYDGHRFTSYTHRPGDPTSLPGNFIRTLYRDRSGDLWVGTGAGLSRLDRERDLFITYTHDPDDPSSLGSNDIASIFEDHSGTMWVGTFGGGLNRFDPVAGTAFRYRRDPEDPDSLSASTVSAIHEDHRAVLWLGTETGLHRLDLDGLDPERPRFRHDRQSLFGSEALIEAGVEAIHEDRAGVLWIGTKQGLVGVDRGRAHLDTYRHDPRDPRSLSAGGVRAIHEDRDGDLWVGTWGGGLNRLERGSGTFRRYRFDSANPRSLAGDTVTSIFEDDAGILWIGALGAVGVSKLDPARQHFVDYVHDADDPASLAATAVMSFAEDGSGNLWVGTFGGGLDLFDRQRGTFEHLRHDPDDPQSLGDDAVWDLLIDRQEVLWVGTWEGGLNRLDGNRRFIHYRQEAGRPESLSSDHVMEIFEDGAGVLWVGTWGGGLNRFDGNRRFTHYRHDPDDPASLSSDLVLALAEAGGDLWLATNDGLNRFDRETGRCRRFYAAPERPNGLPTSDVRSLHRDAGGVLWIGTSTGLVRFDPEGGEEQGFRTYGERDGLTGVSSLTSDEEGNLWLGTGQGISRFDPRTEALRHYDRSDGLIDLSISTGSTFRGRSGELFFGHTEGFVSFRPQELAVVAYRPRVAITDFRLFNESVPIAREGEDSPLERPIELTQEIVLEDRQSVFSFEFSALDFAAPMKNRYAYRLRGFEEDWIVTGADQRFRTYNNLDPGAYIFEVKATGRDGVWSDEVTRLSLRVLAPWWKTWWAYGLYALVVSGCVLGYVRLQHRKVAYERAVSDRLRQVDRLKDEFLANTSHELRTPLYGITGLAESLIDGATGELPEATKANLAMLVHSGRRLTALVDDILDFSKLRHHSLDLDLKPVHLHAVVDVVLALSRPLVGSKQLQLENAVAPNLPAVLADENRLQQILHNLVGNAVKFTEAGEVEVAATKRDGRRPPEGGPAKIVVSVRDTGVGIPEAQQERIFEAFTQADASIEREFGGTGLGLAVSRRLIDLHGGSLCVESTPGEGSTFFFDLEVCRESAGVPAPAWGGLAPAFEEAPDPAPRLTDEAQDPPAGGASVPKTSASEATSLMVVDDEPIIRRVVSNQLTAHGYRVTAAASGEEALRLLAERSIDLVILDVMMPRMSGFEVCRKLRQRYPLEELPVIFLTARNRAEDLVVGLMAGGNDYLPKPVSKSELLARVQTHVALLRVNRQLAGFVAERTSQLAERERLLTERERLIGQLEARNAELARFNYTVAHDLKNPLTTIRNFVGVLERDVAAGNHGRLRRDLGRVDAAAAKLQQLLDELYQLSQIGNVAVSCEEVSFAELVRSAAAELAPVISEREIAIEVAADLPVVCGDRARLLEAVRHLLANACQYLGDQPAPRVEVSTRKDGPEAVILVRDNGRGIETKFQEKVFGLFDRLDPEASEGTGIGLALVKRIVEAHGGRIWVESEGRGQGATFCFTLSRSEGKEDEIHGRRQADRT